MHINFQNTPQWQRSFGLYVIPVISTTGHHHPFYLVLFLLIKARDFTVV